MKERDKIALFFSVF